MDLLKKGVNVFFLYLYDVFNGFYFQVLEVTHVAKEVVECCAFFDF